jgi:hypothetical protein
VETTIILCTPSTHYIFQTSSLREFQKVENDTSGYYQNSPLKKLTKTHKTTEVLDKNFSKDTWTVYPCIIPFLMNILVNYENNLHLYDAPVNHNSLNESKALNIAHTMLGNFCHSDEDKESHIEHMGANACVVVGFNNMVRIY